MAKKTLPTIATLRKLLRYESETGKLFWRERDTSFFSDGAYSAVRACATWNARHAGGWALSGISMYGYKRGNILGREFKAHRVIWAMHYGEWPEGEIDHINHDGIDNRIINLREVTSQENSRNQSMRSANTSGHLGVCWDKAHNKWRAQIVVNRATKYLGLFTDINDAIEARVSANIKYGFHKNHGK